MRDKRASRSYTSCIPSFLMTRRSLSAAVLLCAGFTALPIAMAQDAPVQRACSRLSGKEKAMCEWENQKAYKEWQKNNPVTPDPAAAQTQALALPSCSRLADKERAECLYENNKKIKETFGTGPSVSSAASSATSSFHVVNKAKRQAGIPDACKLLKGKEKAACVIRERQRMRK